MNMTRWVLVVVVVAILCATIAPAIQAAYRPIPMGVDQMWSTLRGLEMGIMFLEKRVAALESRQAQDRRTIMRIIKALEIHGILR